MERILWLLLLFAASASCKPKNLKGLLEYLTVHGREGELSDAKAQCFQEGVTACRRVRIDFERLKALKAGDRLALLPGHGVTLELRRDPKVTSSGGLSLPFLIGDGGEANAVVTKSGAMYGSIRPLSGNVHYVIEACKGKGCTVLLERPKDFFNQFED